MRALELTDTVACVEFEENIGIIVRWNIYSYLRQSHNYRYYYNIYISFFYGGQSYFTQLK